jgi:hypothetical protein
MAAINALITLEEAKIALGIDESNTDYDTRIESLIDSASGSIENYCQTYFLQRTVTAEPVDGGVSKIFLRFSPVVSVSSIVDDAAHTVPSSDYYLDKETGMLRHWGRFPIPVATSGMRTKWYVTYVAGWFASIETVDAALKDACAKFVVMKYENPSGNANSVSVGSLSISYGNTTTSSTGSLATVPDFIAGDLAFYRRGLTP